ncbi:alpha/beta hydrolase [Bacillus pumilus]|uniref:alpha/beta hydrolase n=1 Tax=Bacillus pumilus TaxID=1408 RepID=UPI000B447A64|nr:alpha/beta fold hydrolase [Bacillus pumilus]OUZ12977.1 alpha/beta hydrolase [Bacillus pumilus]
MKKWIAILAFILCPLIAIGIFFTNKMMYIRKLTDEELIKRESDEGHYHHEEFQQLKKEKVCIPSAFGYDLHGYFVPHSHTHTTRTIVLCHGVTVSLINSVKYMRLFQKLGWNVMLYDHRRHGMSGGKTTSYGYYEKEDLAQVVKWLRQRLGENAIIGIHGESMGAVTTLLYAAKPEASANFYIADCPFASFEDQLLYRLKTDFRLSGRWILPLSDRVLKWRDGYSIRQVSPLDVIDQVREPVLFIHSLHDDYIPCEQSQQLYTRKKGKKQLFIAPHGAHAMSFSENKEAYEQEVQAFLQPFDLNEDKRGE